MTPRAPTEGVGYGACVTETRATSVVVVGAGPAGLVAAIVLGSYGIDVVVVDKRAGGSTLSRALVISTRSMEILRSWGVEEEVRAGAADVEPRAWVTRAFVDDDGTEMPLGYPASAEAAAVSPTRPAWAPQDHLEPLLVRTLATWPTVALRYGFELVGLQADADCVRLELEDGATRCAEHVSARYVIGADGAHSRTRSLAGIVMDGPDDLAEFHRVEFRAPLMALAGGRRYGLYVITNPAAAGVLASRGPSDRWGFSREWRAGEPRLVDAPDEQLVQLLATAVGVRSLRPELEQRSTFSFAAQIAQRYRDGRVFLVGDAAHRMTPRGGTGMNTAIQDGYDLGWRLAWVMRGWARQELLDCYEMVRRPVGIHNVERAGQADGARRDAGDALPWDLNGRVPHRWIVSERDTVSTLDLVGSALTLFAGPRDARWTNANLQCRAPITTRLLSEPDATALDIAPAGARLVGPDGRDVCNWADFGELEHRPVPGWCASDRR